MNQAFCALLLTSIVFFLVICVVIYKNKTTSWWPESITFFIFCLVCFGEMVLHDIYSNPQTVKAAITSQTDSPDCASGFYLAPGGKPYPTEADYKKAFSR
jgi:hypothetical protein